MTLDEALMRRGERLAEGAQTRRGFQALVDAAVAKALYEVAQAVRESSATVAPIPSTDTLEKPDA